MKILVTGGSGGLGSQLQNSYPGCLSPTRNDLDVTNKNQVIDYFDNHSIDLVIHTAAITSVRLCEEDRELAWNTNVQGTKNLTSATIQSKNNIKFVYISTACVFDGHGELYKENDKWKSEGKAVLKTRIGVHFGKTLVGNIGSPNRMNYTIMGDTVNVAARLEGINKNYGTNIMVSEEVYMMIKDQFNLEYIDQIELKGKTESTKIYTFKV